MATRRSPLDPLALWRAVELARGTDACIDAEPARHGLRVERRPVGEPCKSERSLHKQPRRAAAAERRQL